MWATLACQLLGKSRVLGQGCGFYLCTGIPVHKVYVTAYSALQRAMINRYVMQNVAAMVDPPKFEKKEIEVYTPAEVSLLMSVAADHRYYLIFLLAFTTGMRLGELLGLRWEDVLKNEIYVRQNLQRTVEEGFILGSPKTAAGKRKIPIHPNAVAALEKHRKEWAANRLAHPMDEKDPFKDLVFFKPKQYSDCSRKIPDQILAKPADHG